MADDLQELIQALGGRYAVERELGGGGFLPSAMFDRVREAPAFRDTLERFRREQRAAYQAARARARER